MTQTPVPYYQPNVEAIKMTQRMSVNDSVLSSDDLTFYNSAISGFGRPKFRYESVVKKNRRHIMP